MPLPAIAAALGRFALGMAEKAAAGEAAAVEANSARKLAQKAAKGARRGYNGPRVDADTASGSLTVDIEEGQKWKDLQKTLKRPERAMSAILAMVTEAVKRRFKTQGQDAGGWKARATPNLAGILSDLSRGTNIKANRYSARPTLVDTGTLRRSIESEQTGPAEGKVYSTVPYAGVLHTGGEVSIPITKTMKANFEKKRDPKFQAKFRWLLQREELKIKIPRRNIFVVTKKTLKEIGEAIGPILDKRAAAAIDRMLDV